MDSTAVWDHFSKSKDGLSATCDICKKTLKLSNRSIKGLRVHLSAVHPFTIPPSAPKKDDSEPAPKKGKITTYFSSGSSSDTSLEAVLARMTAKDGISFQSFVTSDDLKSLFVKCGYKLPSSATTIRSMVMKYANHVESIIRDEIKATQKANGKFSVTFDEWTSRKNRRYMNVNLMYGSKKFRNLGLAYIEGSFNAENCIKTLEGRLSQFGVCFDDITAICTDGPSLMVKVGKLLPCAHVLCLAHGIQLGVIEVLYKIENKDHVEMKSNNPPEIETEGTDLVSDSDGDEEYEDQDCFEITISPSTATVDVHICPDYASLIQKVRKVVKLFRKSPLKSESFLQKYVVLEHGKNMELKLDCRTRWNSLADMLERFLMLKLCIAKALIDANSSIIFSETEWSTILDLVGCLTPVKLAVEALCRRDSTLVSAEATLRFMVEKVESKNTNLSRRFATTLKKRIAERRTNLSPLMLYLQNPQTYYNDMKLYGSNHESFWLMKKSGIRQELKILLTRLIKEDCESVSEDRFITTETVSGPTPAPGPSPSSTSSLTGSGSGQLNTLYSAHLSLKEELELKLQQAQTSLQERALSTLNLETVLKKEMANFDNDNIRGKCLTMAFSYLTTIPPTSVESERAFSAAGYLCTSIRSRLNSDTLNALCMLRSFFQNN